MKIWAHRGCSQRYPENTLLAFEKAVQIPALTGIELDIQLTKDGHMVVIHDERVDRTTEGIGFVRDYTLAELRRLHIYAGTHPAQQIPTIEEVLDLLAPRMRAACPGQSQNDTATEMRTDAQKTDAQKTGAADPTPLLLNIELKNSIYPYPGMEEQIVRLVQERGLEQAVVYSTFYARSLQRLHALAPEAQLGMLDNKVSDCLIKARGLGFACALHPFARSMDLPAEELQAEARAVRVWFSGHLYPEPPTGGRLDLQALAAQGITDLILNEPEAYL